MTINQQGAKRQHSRLLWVHAASLQSALDSATWVETTRHLRHLGWDVILIGEGPRGRHEVAGVDIYCLPKPDRYLWGTIAFHLGLVRFILGSEGAIDIILFHQMSALWLLPLRQLNRLLGRKRPVFVMDTRDLPTTEGGVKNRLRTAYFNFVHWSTNRFADGQTVITPRMAELVDVPGTKLWGIWPSGVDIARFSAAREGRRWPTGDESVRLCYVGKLHLERNLLPLCEAVKAANASGPRFHLSLVGKGPHEVVLRRVAEDSQGGISIEEPVPHEKIPELLHDYHVGVTSLPEPDDVKFQASSPIKLFEYMAAGMPILSTANPCHTDVIGNHDVAFWANEATSDAIINALDAIWADRSRLEQLGQESFSLADMWTWQSAAEKLEAALSYGINT